MMLELIQNVALLVALAVGLQMLARRMARWPLLYHLTAGALFGVACVAGMMTPMRFAPGVIYDARSVVLSLAGLFGGPLAGGIAAMVAGAYRLHLGGMGALVGVLVIVEATGLGMGLYFLRRRSERWVSWPRLWAFGLAVHAGMLALQLLLPEGKGWQVLREVGPTVMLFYPLGFLVVAQVFLEGHRRREAEQRARESEALQQAMISCSPLALYSVDMDGTVLTWNESAERLFGWSEEEVLGKPLPIVPEDKWEEFARLRRRVASGESFTGMELVRRRKDGTLFEASLAVAPLQGQRGQTIGIVGAMEDITPRKEAEDALREQEQRYRSLFENNHAMMMLIDPESGEIVDANPAAVRFYGWTREELVGKPVMEINTMNTPAIREEMAKARQSRRNHFEFQHRLADGSTRDVEVFSGPIRVEQRDLLYSIIHDVTNRKQAENALEESRRRLQTLMGNLPGMAYRCLCHPNWPMDFVSEGCLPLTGYTAEELLHEGAVDYVELIHPDDRHTVWETVQAAVRTGEAFVLEYRIQDKSGMVRWVWERGRPTKAGPQGQTVLEGFIADITDRKQAEETEKQLQQQLAQAQKMEAVGRLAGGVAHDFNNMLQMILGYSDMLLDEVGKDHPFRAKLEEIHRAGARSADLTRQLLAFARKQVVAPVVLDINAAVSDLLKMLNRLIGEDIDLLWQPCAGKCLVRIDPSQIDQILANLVVNSRDAIDGTGKITIESNHAEFDEEYCRTHRGFREGRYEMLAVSDDGTGMDHETLAQVFEPFFTTKDKDKGTGLGLATVYGIVKQNEGFINVYSEPGQGTTVRIYLPAATEGRESSRRMARQGNLPTGSETVLLVEDEPGLLEFGRQVLENLGYTVLPASCPEEALRLAREHPDGLDVLVTDVIMPQMSGRELQQRLEGRHPGLRCLFMSGYTQNVIAHHGVLDEGVYFLQKPFSTSDLARKLREVLDDGPGEEALG